MKKTRLESDLCNIINELYSNKKRKINETEKIDKKEEVCKIILDELAGISYEEGKLAKITIQNVNNPGDKSRATGTIQLTEYPVEINIEVETLKIFVYAKYIGDDLKVEKSYQPLFTYRGETAYNFMCYTKSGMVNFKNLLLIQTIRYISYLKEVTGEYGLFLQEVIENI